MLPSSASDRRAIRGGPVQYAHSPYMYRITVEDALASPPSDHARPGPSSVPNYRSPRSLSQSTGNADSISISAPNKSSSNLVAAQAEHPSHPNSPLGRSTPGKQEYSQPIQVGSAPNVHPRYRRSAQSPMTRAGNESGSRSGFPSSPPGSLPPRSSFVTFEDGSFGFSGGESGPVRGLNNPYRLPSAAGLSAPQYPVPLSGSYRSGNNMGGGGGFSGSQSPAPYQTRQHSGSGASASPLFGALTTLPPNMAAAAAPAYGSSTTNMSNAPATGNNTFVNNNTYAPTGFSLPPTMTAGASGSYHGTPSGCAGSQPGSYVDPRSSYPSSPLASNGRPPVGNSGHVRGEPISPTHIVSSGSHRANMNADGTTYTPHNHSKGGKGAPPPSFATALQQQQQQQHSGGFAVGSFPGRRSAPSGHPASPPFLSHMSLNASCCGGADNDLSLVSESYGTNTKTLSAMADDTASSSGKSGSSASSIRDDLPLCPHDDSCTTINDRKHQKKYAHTCRLFPCYHGHVRRHAKLFRHAPGQISMPEGLTAGAKVSSHALASVNFSTISPEAPNAYRIYVSHGDKSYEIFGDWASVKVHTFKRYLHQVYHIPPGSQILSVMRTGKVMDDDINTVKCYGIEEDSVILLRSDMEDAPAFGKLRIPLDDL
ncbi:hypothetical protein ABL78_1817 [Leptomonas seymouri]|uniref:Ubiquitin-like domain-containing protein n=1 Tax=Leptomonas seymouri TaxID=5684 RepID=A0A0N1I056_LEPSE|nr:hypothetical protein ABL78_1817 [Leptomonas seymouri]|eukprot:KPI89081.1 hypothetical protein ABL78_1817 [Leptomonas seymouri]